MFRIDEILIDDFWHRANAKCDFKRDVNIIIGKNGSGKTTFMNIVQAALTVDLDGIVENDFKTIVIKLSNKGTKRTVQLTKVETDRPPFQFIKYQISQKVFHLRAFTSDDRIPPSYRRRLLEETNEVKTKLSEIVSLSTLSVNRLRSGEDFEIKDRAGKRLMSPIDFRLDQLMNDFTQYQYELSEKINQISSALQKQVLASLLYSGSQIEHIKVPKNFNKSRDRRQLISAYQRLEAYDQDIRNGISKHIDAIDAGINKLNVNEELTESDWAAFQSYYRTQEVIEMSLKAEKEISTINAPIYNFFDTLNNFMPEKDFYLESGKIIAYSFEADDIPVERLSSGEKQLLILLIETLLQKNKACIYLTDEPELSLHIEWQRKILPSIKKLNPNAQIIAATHSPEVASRYKDNIINMKQVIING